MATDLLKTLKEANQEQVLHFWNELNDKEKEALLADIRSVDFTKINQLFKQVNDQSLSSSTGQSVSYERPTPLKWKDGKLTVLNPFENDACVISNLDTCSGEVKSRWHKRGLELIKQGKVGALIMAGGQGTRLGWTKPKGTYPIGPVSEKSLFQLFCERICRIREMAGSPKSLPFYIMTGDHNHEATMTFFENNQFFGLPKEDVFFFQQESLPCLSLEGKVLLETKSKIAKSPNGNGGVFLSLKSAGLFDDVLKRGLVGLHVFGVDNALTKVLDPTFIGFSDELGVDVGNKCVIKIDPNEPIGVMCQRTTPQSGQARSKQACVVEYSDATEEIKFAKSGNSLLYNAGNICNHYFSVKFLDSVLKLSTSGSSVCPPHKANKKIPCVDIGTGVQTKPTKPNGIKIEYFIFDWLEAARKVAGFLVDRNQEFSPVKNATGQDSPQSCRLMLSDLCKIWVLQSGGQLTGEGFLEVSPLLTFEGEDLKKYVENKTFKLPAYIA